jgi:uncharacterized protein YdhG (YjbR/CyaY superfamily)
MNQEGSIDEYIAGFPAHVQEMMQKLRQVIREAAPGAVEVISYGMPAFKQNGIVVYFGGFKDHIGFFPTSSGVAAFKDELAPYATSKGTIQFQYDKPIPYDMVKRMVKFRVNENLKK